jgi:peptide/nickel transport system permease protein
MNRLRNVLTELRRYPSAVFGLAVILVLFGVAVYAVVSIPYQQAIYLWRGGEQVWYQNPKNAAPVWYNWFSKTKQAETLILDSRKGQAEVVTEERESGRNITLTYRFDYQYDTFPQEVILYFHNTYSAKQPFVTVYWVTPDGREYRIASTAVGSEDSLRFSQQDKLKRRLGTDFIITGLFMDPNSAPDNPKPLKGEYQIRIEGVTFEPDADIQAEMVMHGTLAGWAGTDHLRRDLMIALLWGTPVALLFGLIASLGTSVLTMIIAAVGVWFGGWVDELIQRITEINLVLPFLSILIMVGTFYSRSIWVILGVTILLSIFTGGIKSYRAIFLQIKESTYIEAARAYGANDARIVFRYLIPRIIPLLIPGLVSGIPSFVFLEASLAVLGLGDPVLPTWGKIINDAQSQGALYNGYFYWILEPAVLLIITGFAFAMLGFALDRIFNPRLREL